MQSVEPRHEEIGREILTRMRLLEQARDPRSFWRERLGPMLGGMGLIMLVLPLTEVISPWWVGIAGVLAAAGYHLSGPSRAERRLDALVDLLVRTGQLEVADDQ